MRTVYKYEVPILDNFSLDLPRGAKLLAFQPQRGAGQLWALVDPTADTVQRNFRLAGTGHPIEEEAYTYVGSAQFAGGDLVFHLFEVH